MAGMPTREVKGSVLGEVEERVTVVHVQDWIFGVTALEIGSRHLDQRVLAWWVQEHCFVSPND